MILVREGIITWNTLDQKNQANFNTEAYLAGQYEAVARRSLRDASGADRRVSWSDGLLLPSYRLPTEAEWEYAAVGLIGTTEHEMVAGRRLYPWGGTQNLRSPDKKNRGTFLANFKRGRGDYMGVAGALNDGGSGPVPVYSYWPNDYGLYNMAGNVNEWVLDVYRPLSFEDVADLRPYRGNVFQTLKLDENGNPVPKDEFGRLIFVEEEPSETRRNYRRADYRDYHDGDLMSSLEFGNELADSAKLMYEYGVTSLVNNESRVYKGGGWNDNAYWLVPGTRRFLDQNEAAADIGFRCAMIRVGSPDGSNPKKRK
jgi:formylglycine-generating enzyme required for sulfatase activity